MKISAERGELKRELHFNSRMQGDQMRNTLCIPIEGNEADGCYEKKLTVFK